MNGGKTLVTGAGGFIGSAVSRALVADGRRVVGLVEPGGDTRSLTGLDLELVTGDLKDPAAVRRAVDGCSSVFHVAALYRFWARDPGDFYAVNVGGTRNVLAAARAAGVERVVYTSTVGTLGLHSGRPATELDYPDVAHLFGAYKRSKYVAEHEALRAGAEGLPVTLVLPTTPLGPRDRAPTPTGRIVLDFLSGRMPGYVDTVLNVVHVDDVARGHLLAHERGAVGRSYILGGENLSLRELLTRLAASTGLPAPRVRAPRSPPRGSRTPSRAGCCAARRTSRWRQHACRPPTWPSTTAGRGVRSATPLGRRVRRSTTRHAGTSTTAMCGPAEPGASRLPDLDVGRTSRANRVRTGLAARKEQ